MNKSITPAISITIAGATGAGKSLLLNLIGSYLQIRRFNAHCFEKLKSESVIDGYELKPFQPSPQLMEAIDSRLIEITAINFADETQKTCGHYSEITKKAEAEIMRLIHKANEKLTIGEDPETYRNWAYGVFLGWKAAVGEQIKTVDLNLLEALAIDEQSLQGK